MCVSLTHLGTLVVFTQQRVRQCAQRGEQHPVGDTQREDHIEVGGQRGQPRAKTERQVGKEIQRSQREAFLQLLQYGWKTSQGKTLVSLALKVHCVVFYSHLVIEFYFAFKRSPLSSASPF